MNKLDIQCYIGDLYYDCGTEPPTNLDIEKVADEILDYMNYYHIEDTEDIDSGFLVNRLIANLH